MLVLAGCERTSTKSETSDPPEAFYPHVIVLLDQTGRWGGFKLEVEKVTASVGREIRDIRLSVDLRYTNLGSEDLRQPDEVTFEFDGQSYPADSPGQIELPGNRFVDGPVPGGVTADGWIRGTLTGFAKYNPPSEEEVRAIVVKTQLVLGAAGTNRVVFRSRSANPAEHLPLR